MSVKEIDNQNATKANATRGNAYEIYTNKHIKHDPSEPITISIREKATDRYKNAHIQPVAIEFLRRRKQDILLQDRS